MFFGCCLFSLWSPVRCSLAVFWASCVRLEEAQERKNADSPMRKPHFWKSSFVPPGRQLTSSWLLLSSLGRRMASRGLPTGAQKWLKFSKTHDQTNIFFWDHFFACFLSPNASNFLGAPRNGVFLRIVENYCKQYSIGTIKITILLSYFYIFYVLF